MSDEYDDEFEDLVEALDKISTALADVRVSTNDVLGHAYAVLVRVDRDEKMRDELRRVYKKAFKDQTNTDDAMRVVKLKISDDRQAAHPYALRLRKALKEKITIDAFPDWLHENGIYGKKGSTSPSDVADKQKLEAKRRKEFDAGYDKVAKMPSKGSVEWPDLLTTENVFAVLLSRHSSGDKTLRIHKIYSGDTDPVLGPELRRIGRE